MDIREAVKPLCMTYETEVHITGMEGKNSQERDYHENMVCTVSYMLIDTNNAQINTEMWTHISKIIRIFIYVKLLNLK